MGIIWIVFFKCIFFTEKKHSTSLNNFNVNENGWIELKLTIDNINKCEIFFFFIFSYGFMTIFIFKSLKNNVFENIENINTDRARRKDSSV